MRQKALVALSRWLFSSLSGMTAGDWLAVLERADFAVDPPYLPRALLLSLATVPATIDRRRERRQFGPALAAATVPPPVFVLGHWRTGTTFLHGLLAADPRLAYPNLYQVFNPHTFLLNEAWQAKQIAAWLPERRLMDDVKVGIDTPQEDEFALCAATGLSPYLGWAFPRRRDFFDRYLTFRGVPPAEVARWRGALHLFVRKLAVRYPGRPAVLKSPPHTGRVRMLLDAFPDARFVHIRRNPYAVFQSTRHLERTAGPAMAFQRFRDPDPDAGILRRYATMYDAYLEERGRIPAGRLHELRYEDLARDPAGELRALYAALGLPDFEATRPAVEAHLAQERDYRPNRFRPLTTSERGRVVEAWGRFFAAWGYEA